MTRTTLHPRPPGRKTSNTKAGGGKTPAKRPRAAHIWAKEAHRWYVEPAWCSTRLFDVEDFNHDHVVLDPMCGFGRILESAKAANYVTVCADIVDRGYPGTRVQDFFKRRSVPPTVITNPSFEDAEQVVAHAFRLGAQKIAIVMPVATLCAAVWAFSAPLRRIWLLSPRPSMPPRQVILRGEKPEGGRVDYCWAVFESGYSGHPETQRLHRDGAQS
jgi:hypothetical protein